MRRGSFPGEDPRTRVYRTRVTDDWLPLPAGVVAEMGLREGDTFEIEIAPPDHLILTLVERGPEPARGKDKHP